MLIYIQILIINRFGTYNITGLYILHFTQTVLDGNYSHFGCNLVLRLEDTKVKKKIPGGYRKEKKKNPNAKPKKII